MKKFKRNNGITLVALVMTIIIMLILVAVTISLTIKGGLFGYAGNAVKDTENAKNNELALANGSVTIDGVTYSSMDAYKQSLSCEHNWGEEQITKQASCSEEGEKTVTCSICGTKKTETIAKTNHTYANNSAWEIIPEEGKEKNTCTVCGQEIKRYIVGATILGYDPTNNNTIKTSYTSLGSYDSSVPGEYGDGTTGNGYDNQINVLVQRLDWKVLGEENGQIIITPSYAITRSLSFKGRSGYAHCIEELDKICSIYGQGTYADTTKFDLTRDITKGDGTLDRQETIKNASGARSISVEDLKRIGFNVRENSYTFLKDPTTQIIRNESISGNMGNYQTFIYWNENTSNETKPFTFLELQTGERVTVSGISSISGSVSTSVENMITTFGSGSDNYRIYFLATRSFYIPTSDGDPRRDEIRYFAYTVSPDRYGGIRFGLGELTGSAYSYVDSTGRYYRPVVYLRPDVSVSYNSETGKYTINS